MKPIFLLPVWAAVAFVLYYIVNLITTRHRRSAMAKKMGCEPAPRFTQSDLLAYGDVKELLGAADDGTILSLIARRLDSVSKQEGRPVFTFDTHVLRNWIVVTCDPKNIQAVLATQFKEFELGPIRYGTFSPLLGNGVFSVDGARWEHARAMLRPQFARDQLFDPGMEEQHVQNLLKALPVTGKDGWTGINDFIPLFFRLTMDSAAEFLFGSSVDSQLAALPVESGLNPASSEKRTADAEFVRSFERTQELIAYAFRFNDWYRFAMTKELYAECKTAHKYIDNIVEATLRKHDKGVPVGSNEKQKYVFAEALLEETRDVVEIRSQLLSILVAGRDTTASLLSFLWLILARQPERYKRLREAVINDFGTYDAPTEYNFSKLKSCQYLQWCLNETLRLFPTVPMNSRRSIVDTTLPRGGGPDGKSPIFVPKGTEVNYSVYVMHRNKNIWGADADEFRPERWEGLKFGFEYLPFNGGPRICLGQQFALAKAGYVTLRLAQKFDKIDGSALVGDPDRVFLHLTGRPKNPVDLRVHSVV